MTPDLDAPLWLLLIVAAIAWAAYIIVRRRERRNGH